MTSNSKQHQEAVKAQAFREITLGLICLFQAYGVQHGLASEVGKVLWRIFARYLGRSAADIAVKGPESLRKIANDLGRIAVAAPLPHEGRAQPRCACLRPPHCPIRTAEVQ